MQKPDIIIAEDNETMRLGIAESLRREGYGVRDFDSAPAALESLRKKPVALVITDLKMSPMSGSEFLAEIKKHFPATEVLMISAFGTIETAVEAMRLGAADFLTKPFSMEELRIRVQKLSEKIARNRELDQLKAENILLQEDLSSHFSEIIGKSRAMQQVFSLIERVANEDSTVLVEGESGTGKELIARAIHRKSRRSGSPFVRVNCGALNDNLLESELFGHEKGAFTGAIKQKKGRFELAHGGTLFLDEIGDVSPTMQVKLLRALQEQEFERVGGEQTIQVDVRIIAATNKNLQQLIHEGTFREDLFYRLSVIPVKLPPLRERKEDIPLLIRHFMDKFLRNKEQTRRQIPPEGLKIMQEYSWPGNIRELENLLERLMVISAEEQIDPRLIAQHLGGAYSPNGHYQDLPLEDALFAFEKNLISHALKQSGGVKNQAAKLLGIRTSTLYYKMEKFGLM